MFVTFVEDTPASKHIAWTNMAIIILNMVIALKTINLPGFQEALGHYGFIPVRGLSLGLFTGPFIHSSWAQLLTNMTFLYMFGKGVEQRLGKLNYLMVYGAIALTSELVHWYFNAHSPLPLVGASRVVTGLGVIYLLMYPWGKMKWVFNFFGAPIMEIPSRTLWVMVLWAGVQATIAFMPWARLAFLIHFLSSFGLSLFTLIPTAGTAWHAHLGAVLAGVGLHFLMPQKKGKA